MNGYFNNLAIRTVSHGNLVQPRTASVFEPQGALATDYGNETGSLNSNPVSNFVPATQHATINPPEKVVATEASSEPDVSSELTASHDEPPSFQKAESQHTEPETEITQPVLRNTRHVLPAPLGSVNDVVVHENAIALPQSATTTVPTTPTRKTTVPQSQLLEPEAEDGFHAAQAERSVSPVIKTVSQETKTFGSAHDFNEHLTQRTNRAEQTNPSQRTNRAERTNLTERTDRTQQTKRTHPTQQATHSKQAASRRDQLFLESPTEAEPSINITIGRVEVRATPTNAQKQKPARTASPVMPLEEYLRKQRRGDER